MGGLCVLSVFLLVGAVASTAGDRAPNDACLDALPIADEGAFTVDNGPRSVFPRPFFRSVLFYVRRGDTSEGVTFPACASVGRAALPLNDLRYVLGSW